MAENTYKKKPVNKKTGKKAKWLDVPINFLGNVDENAPTRYLPHFFFLAAIGIFYIANTHQAEKVVRLNNKLEAEVENLRSDYTTLKAEYDVYTSKQSLIAEKAKALKLKENNRSIKKIIIPKGEY